MSNETPKPTPLTGPLQKIPVFPDLAQIKGKLNYLKIFALF